jgi:hypothetical protein
MTLRRALSTELDLRGFSVGDALLSGMSNSRLRSPDLTSPFWGVRAEIAADTDTAGRAIAFLSRGSGMAIISHFSAAKLWGIPLPQRWSRSEDLDVSVPPDTRAPKGRGIPPIRNHARESE